MIVLIPARDPDAALIDLITGLRNRGLRDIVVVDDGSGPAAAPILAAIAGHATVLTHPGAAGKGRALKTGIAHCLAVHPGLGVVTVDPDGRHALDDVVAVAEALAREPNRLVVGCRRFAPGRVAPARRLGGLLTRTVLAVTGGVRLADPLCGLRGLPAQALPKLAMVAGEGCEYEFNVLMTARSHGLEAVAVPIEAIATDGPRARAFDPVRDSFAFAFLLLRFALSSLGCAALDVVLFFVLTHGSLGLGAAVATARAVSSLLNFGLNRGFVFRSDRPVAAAVALYYLLVAAIALLSYLLTRALAASAGLPLVAAKVVADSLLFVVSFLAQRHLVFARRTPAAFITPAGAGIAIICFFLPWLRLSCLRELEFTGVEIAHFRSIYWWVLIGEAAVVVLWTLGKLKLLRRSALYVAAAATVPLAIIFAPVLKGERTRGLDLELQVGAYGTILGLAAALLGAVSWRRGSGVVSPAGRSRGWRRRPPRQDRP
jgi:putative flippase GtrA